MTLFVVIFYDLKGTIFLIMMMKKWCEICNIFAQKFYDENIKIIFLMYSSDIAVLLN